MNDIKTLRGYYSALSDDALLESHARGKSVYEAMAWNVIAAEMDARGLKAPGAAAVPLRAEPQPESAAGRPAVSASDARRQMTTGIGVAIAGAILTIVGYATAAPDQSYAIWWGAIVFGVMRALRATAALDRATAWEARARVAGDDTITMPADIAAELRQLEKDYANALRQGVSRYVAQQSFERQAAPLRERAERLGR